MARADIHLSVQELILLYTEAVIAGVPKTCRQELKTRFLRRPGGICNMQYAIYDRQAHHELTKSQSYR